MTLVSNEHCEPYEKPPLSKAVLTGKVRIEDALIAGPKGLAGHGIVLQNPRALHRHLTVPQKP